MFIRTKDQRLINTDKVDYFEILPYLNEDKAELVATIGDKVFSVFIGTTLETEVTFNSLAFDIEKGDRALVNFDNYFNKET